MEMDGWQILWMCGGHQEHRSKVIESAGVQPKTRGDVEPCNPIIKSSLGISRFTHVKDLLKVPVHTYIRRWWWWCLMVVVDGGGGGGVLPVTRTHDVRTYVRTYAQLNEGG